MRNNKRRATIMYGLSSYNFWLASKELVELRLGMYFFTAIMLVAIISFIAATLDLHLDPFESEASND